jgi:pyruvate,orthophosphate dikinase
MNNIDDMLGTAVNVQAMVFRNLGDTSGSGVGFTRNLAIGTKEFYGEFLMNAGRRCGPVSAPRSQFQTA